jgi:catechol 2,3-dioxygenase-like lactoylglutathione lyase family enzyme
MKTEIEKILSPYDEATIRDLILGFFRENEAARIFVDEAQNRNWPVVLDHITIRCMDVDRRAQEFLKLGYEDQNELVEYPDQGWWAKVYRRKGYPALFIDQAYADARGEQSILPDWVKKFGDRNLHHVAVRVDDIDAAVEALEKHGVEFSGKVVGAPGTRLRQVFTAAEVREGMAYSVLELAERNGYDGFYPEQADSLMQSSTKKKTL